MREFVQGQDFDVADYLQRLQDRTTDWELRCDGAAVKHEIMRLRKENDALKEENDRLKSMDLHSACHKREDALKAALRRISELAPYQSIEGIRLARQALAKLEGVTPSAP